MNNFETALVHSLCIICATKVNERIVINKLLTKSMAAKVEAMHNKAVGFADPCKTCQENLDKAFLFIGFDEDKSDLENLPQGFYRTGHIIGVKKNSKLVQEFVLNVNKHAYELGYMFTPLTAMKQLNLLPDEIN